MKRTTAAAVAPLVLLLHAALVPAQLNKPTFVGRMSASSKTNGPYELTAADMRTLLGSPIRPGVIRDDLSADNLVAITRNLPRVNVTEARFAGAAAEGGAVRRRAFVPLAPQPPPPPTQTPAAAVSWEAPDMSVGNPPDPQIAASHSHVVVVTQQTLAFYAKDGTQVGKTSFVSFFSKMGLNNGTVNGSEVQSDPRLIFDAYRNRFWVIHGAGNGMWLTNASDPKTVRGRIYAAVSKTENPLDGWWLYWWDAVAEWNKPGSLVYQPGDGADYPSIGIDPVAFYQTIIVKNAITGRAYSWVVIKPADQLAKGIAADGSRYIFKDPNGNFFNGIVQPTVHHGPTGRAYFVARWGADQLLVWSASNVLQSPAFSHVTVTLTNSLGMSAPFGAPQNAPLKGSTGTIYMTNLGTTPLKAVYRGGFLYIVAMDARDWFKDGKMLTSIRLVRLPVNGFPAIVTSPPGYINRVFGMNNIIDDQPKVDRMFYGWPAVEVNRNADMVVVYARSGTSIYPEVRFSAYYHGESDIRPSRLLHQGEASYPASGTARWGDLGGASVDPEDDRSIWIVHQYAKPGGYGIWVGKVSP